MAELKELFDSLGSTLNERSARPFKRSSSCTSFSLSLQLSSSAYFRSLRTHLSNKSSSSLLSSPENVGRVGSDSRTVHPLDRGGAFASLALCPLSRLSFSFSRVIISSLASSSFL